jgi:hypothetical protein
MLKPFSMIFFILVMVWTGAIFLTSSAATRIERACIPATVTDKIVVSIVQLVYEPWAMDAHQMMLNVEYGCKYTVWKTFYEDVLDKSGAQEVTPKAAHAASAVPQATPAVQQQQKQVKPVDAQVSPAEEAKSTDADGKKPIPNYMDSK